MTAGFKVPLIVGSQTLKISIGGIKYSLAVTWRNDLGGQGGYVLDINDGLGNPIADGLAMNDQTNLLDDLEYLSIGGGVRMYVESSSGAVGPVPYSTLGGDFNLYWVLSS
jgi:hypothetical protein